MIQFLVDNPLFALLLCLGVGYVFGKMDFGAFPNNATLSTLYAAIVMNIIISASGAEFDAEHVRLMKTFFLALFFFLLGYDAGPLFRDAVRKSGMKLVVKLGAMSLFYCVCVYGFGFFVMRLFGYGVAQSNGIIAGSQSELVIASLESDVIAYSLTFIMASALMVGFAQKAAPRLIGTDLISIVKEKVGVGNAAVVKSATLSMPVQIRAYKVDADSPYSGQTIDELEAPYEGRLQIENVYRDGVELELKQSQTVLASDVIVVLGPIRDIDLFDNNGLTETTEEEYVSFEMARLEIVVSEKRVERILDKLSGTGIMINRILRKGREIVFSNTTAAEKGDILSVTGRPQTILKAIENIGYVKEEGDSADMPLLLLPMAFAIPMGLLGVPGTGFTLGTSCCTLVIGMIVGCVHESNPKIGYISPGAKWLLKSMGLNMFFAATALESPLPPNKVFVVQNIYILIAGVIMALVPAILSVLFGRMVLRLEPADVIGGLCGCTTCTSALNALTEVTGSTIFVVGYTPAYAVSLIFFVLLGTVLIPLM